MVSMSQGTSCDLYMKSQFGLTEKLVLSNLFVATH